MKFICGTQIALKNFSVIKITIFFLDNNKSETKNCRINHKNYLQNKHHKMVFAHFMRERWVVVVYTKMKVIFYVLCNSLRYIKKTQYMRCTVYFCTRNRNTQYDGGCTVDKNQKIAQTLKT